MEWLKQIIYLTQYDVPLTGPFDYMHFFKPLYQTTVGLFKQAWMFPHFVAAALKQRRRQFALDVIEAERLDRIRHPSKYLGK